MGRTEEAGFVVIREAKGVREQYRDGFAVTEDQSNRRKI